MSNSPDETPKQQDAVDELAEKVCELLSREPFRSRLIAQLGLATGEGAREPLPTAKGFGEGPVPIGPYEIMPEFSAVRWDGVPPSGGEWPEVALERTVNAGEPQPSVYDGPRVTRPVRERRP